MSVSRWLSHVLKTSVKGARPTNYSSGERIPREAEAVRAVYAAFL